ncbi:M24 family metallopeptidase [Clostridium akagii]|uniref:M24 family metallopeptidase n=1 Tax=Clostridium akagii TaxID=91623 RepID=UPI00047D8C67|nr:Xaa-Pro peptidase family protein [Clostridium akagii]
MEEKRLDRILTSMEKYKIPQLIITSPSAIFYLTGKWIESGERMCAIFIDQSGVKKFVINALFPINDDTGFDIITFNDSEDPIEKLTPFIDKKAVLGIDKNWQSSFLIRLMDKLQGISVVNGSFIMDEVRIIKDDDEIQLLKEASKINDMVIDELIKNISEGSKEVDLARNLVDIYAKHGTEQFSFEPLIAFGKNGAEPHHSSDNSILKKGNSIIIDIGGKTNGYCSDMTRTVFYGEISERQKEIYNLVHQANLQGIKAVRPGTKFSDIDKAARDVIANAGYGEYFTHRTGHNVGIDVHEPTDVSSINNSEVEEGMVFSIEPGIYLPNEFGVRIEDLVLVTKDGCEILNSYDKNIKII